MGHIKKEGNILAVGVLVAVFSFIFNMGILFTDSAHAASYVNVSSGGSGDTAGVVSLGKIKPSSSGSTATGNDTLTVHTDCSAGYKVYVSGQNGKTTNLTNQSATDPINPSSSDIISASSNTIASPNTLSSNTWGISGNSTDIENHLYAGLPAYSSATNASLVTKSDVAEESTVPIYYGVNANTAINPGTYSGDILYTVLMDTSCIPYTVEFNPNVTNSADVTGEMTAQSILPNSATALTANAYEREGYTFLGWSTTPEGKTGNVTNGIGTTEDVDYDDEAEVTNLTTSGSSITLYAIWEVAPTEYMQDFMCSRLSPNGDTKTLVDKRDGQEYTVYRIPTNNAATDVAGKCIMTKDLNLGAVNSVSGSSSTITANGTMTLSPEDSTFTTPTGSGESITVPTSNVTVSSSYSSTNSYSNKYYVANGTGDYAERGYYSWGAAMVACPKGWRLPTQDEFNNNNSNWNASTTGISKAVNNNISTIQSSPWSFVLGGDYDDGFGNAGSNGYYWSSTQNDSAYSYFLRLNSSNGLKRYNSNKRNGFAVRCMADDYDNTMQDFDNSALTNVGDTAKLLDTRDNKIYTVKKLPDGKVWMMQNLTIGSDGAKTLTSADTNIDNNTTYYLPPAGKQGSSTIDNSSTLTATTTANFSTSNDNRAKTQFRTKNTSYTNDSDTGYYTFYTATLGFSYYNDSKSSGTSTRDICPKGWRLPKTTDSGTNVTTVGSTNDFTYLALQYNSSTGWNGSATGTSGYDYYNDNNVVKNPMYLQAAYPLATSTANNYAGFSYAGQWYGTNSSALYVGSDGYYWSASVSNTYSGYYLYFNSSGVNPQRNSGKHNGFAVRCVAQNSATITFDANGGTGEMSQQKLYENDATLKSNTFTRDGYAFIGWSEDANATTASYTNGASASDLVSRGGNITLYAVWVRIDGDMQNFMCMDSTIASGETKTLRDSRDGQLYTVYRIPTDNVATNVAGKCIMTKDLNLGAVNSVSGSSSTITANGTMTLSPEDSTFTTPSGSGESITVPTSTVSVTHGTPGSGNNNYANRQYRIDGTGNYAGRGYYTWGAAMVACPKGWRLPTQDELNNNDSYNASTTGISKAVNNSLSTLQSSPWSFVLGGFYINSFGYAGSNGGYWSSTQDGTGRSYYLNLDSSSFDFLRRFYNSNSYGFAVRCVADVPQIMQNTSCSSLPTDQTSTLVDSRDGQAYSVYRFKNTGTAGTDYPSNMSGYCLMTKDLSLGYKTGGSITKDSNLALTTADSAGSGTINYVDSANNGEGWSTVDDDSNLQYTNGPKSGSESVSSHSYYSFGAARQVCPKGWTLPTSTQYSNLETFLGGRWNALNEPYNFLEGGYFYSSGWMAGGIGKYWASDESSATTGEHFMAYIGNAIVGSSMRSNKNIGMSVRCVQETYTLCFTAGTQIQTTMSGDTKPIEDIKIGDEVVSYDPNNHEYYMTEVLSTVIHDGEERANELAKLILSNGTELEMSLNHPILTTTGYKALQNEEYETLTEDDIIVTTTGEYSITNIDIYHTEPTVVYNFTVRGKDGDIADGLTHSYIANGVVVHNTTSGGGSF